MIDLAPQFLAALALFVAGAAFGFLPMRKLIEVYEAKHELKHGSAGFLRMISGWSIIVIWLLVVWFFATIIGDWGSTGDLDGAVERSMLRLRIIAEIIIAVLESD
ncbi:MAG: hypothetical protein AAF401_05790 [Pseudomonadota bacterium]